MPVDVKDLTDEDVLLALLEQTRKLLARERRIFKALLVRLQGESGFALPSKVRKSVRERFSELNLGATFDAPAESGGATAPETEESRLAAVLLEEAMGPKFLRPPPSRRVL